MEASLAVTVLLPLLPSFSILETSNAVLTIMGKFILMNPNIILDNIFAKINSQCKISNKKLPMLFMIILWSTGLLKAFNASSDGLKIVISFLHWLVALASFPINSKN